MVEFNLSEKIQFEAVSQEHVKIENIKEFIKRLLENYCLNNHAMANSNCGVCANCVYISKLAGKDLI